MQRVMIWQYEVRTPEMKQWVPFDAALWSAAELPVPDRVERLGRHVVTDTDPRPACEEPLDPVQFAATELARGLDELGGAGQAAGVRSARIALWIATAEEDRATVTAADPDVIITATDAQLLSGRIAWAAAEVDEHQMQLEQARTRLRRHLLAARRHGPRTVGRNELARVAHPGWSRRLVLAFLAGRDLVDEVFAAMPAEWPRDATADDPLADPIGNRGLIYRCGSVALQLDNSGTVRVSIEADDSIPGDEDLDAMYAATGDTEASERCAARQAHRHRAAQALLDRLHTAGLGITQDAPEAAVIVGSDDPADSLVPPGALVVRTAGHPSAVPARDQSGPDHDRSRYRRAG